MMADPVSPKSSCEPFAVEAEEAERELCRKTHTHVHSHGTNKAKEYATQMWLADRQNVR